MTTEDYKIIASALKSTLPSMSDVGNIFEMLDELGLEGIKEFGLGTHKYYCLKMALYLEKANPKFDRDAFFKDCGSI